ncbi:MAG TPA: transglycosylase SLT domain-containing protein [Alphaproteobacteria bacterium]
MMIWKSSDLIRFSRDSRVVRRIVGACLAATLFTAAHAQAATVWINADAAYVLALRYENGIGVPRDYARVFEFYCDADRLGHAGATFNIGWLYAQGQAVKRDAAQAAAWLRRAELRGHPQAAALLSELPDAKVVQPLCPTESEEADSVADIAAKAEIVQVVRTMAPFYGIDPELALAVVRVESSFRANAVSPRKARGLMQLRPATAARFGAHDAADMISNLHGGLSYLRFLLDRFGGDVRLALAGYNAGESAVARHGGVPPYAETREYLKKLAVLYPRMNAGEGRVALR